MSRSSQSQLDHCAETHDSTASDAPPRIASADLLRGQRKLIIDHGETTYVLVLTRNGKLILNK